MNEYSEIVDILDIQWNEIKEIMKRENFCYKNINQIRKIDFFDRLFQIIEDDSEILSANQNEIKHIYRSAASRWDDVERFIPKFKYASLNRMNGKDKLYYYFGISYKKYCDDAIKTCFHEIRLEDEVATVCEFKLKNNLRIIDFTKDANPPKNEIEAIDYIKRYINKDHGFKLAMARLYFSLFSDSGAFTPIDKDNCSEDKIKALYMPFWSLAEYLEENKYDGMIFSSSVTSNGKNLVIFNLDNAYPIESSLKILKKSEFKK